MSAVNYSGPHRNKWQCLCIIWGANEGVLWEMCKCRMSSCISWLFMKIVYHLLTSMDWKFGNNEVASVITWSDKECIYIERSDERLPYCQVPKDSTQSPRNLFKNHLSFHVSRSFPSPRANPWSGGGGGEGEWGTPTYHTKVTWWVLVVSLGDRMTFYQDIDVGREIAT